MSVGRYLLRRFVASIIVLIGVSIVIFLMARLIPGDTARIAAGPRATTEMVERIRGRLHLDESLPMQYYYFLKGLSEGDLGISIYSNRAVVKDIAEFFPATFELVLLSGLVHGLDRGAAGDFVGTLSRRSDRQCRTRRGAPGRCDTDLRVGDLPDAAVRLCARSGCPRSAVSATAFRRPPGLRACTPLMRWRRAVRRCSRMRRFT